MVGALVTAGARAVFTYKMMGWSLPDSPDACLRLIAAVDSPERNYRSSDVGSVLRVLGEKGAVVRVPRPSRG